MFDNPTQTVPVSRNENSLPLLELRDNDVIPVRKGSLDGELQGLEHGELVLAGPFGVPRVIHNLLIVRMILLHRRRGHVKAPSPNLNLVTNRSRILLFINR